MAKHAVAFLVCLSMFAALLVSPSVSTASQGQDQRLLKKASAHLARLTKDKKKRQFHHEWEKCIAEFDSIIRKYPDSPSARKALFMKGEAYSGIYKLSRAQADLDLAMENYEQYIGKYPKSADAKQAKGRLKSLTGVDTSAAPATATERKKTAVKADNTPAVSATEPVPVADAIANDAVLVKEIRHWSNTGYTRVVIDLGGKATFKASRLRRPDRLVFDIKKGALGDTLKNAPVTINDGILKTIRASQFNGETVRVVLDLESIADYRTLMLPDPKRLVIDVEGKRAAVAKRSGRGRVITLKSARNEEPAPVLTVTTTVAPQKCIPKPETVAEKAATPLVTIQDQNAQPATQSSVQPGVQPEPAAVETPSCKAEPADGPVRKVCIGTIVIDPGHGGKDTGAIGKKGLYEKDVVLDIGIKLRNILKRELGCKVVMTRDRDVFIELNDRPGIAIKYDADLFISIHANASPDRAAKGIETYLLNTTKDRNIMALAAQENMMTVEQLKDIKLVSVVNAIQKDFALDFKREESLRLAHVIQTCLVKDLQKDKDNNVNDKGVKQGPFLVLYGAEMPSILTEVGFISNADEEAKLGSSEYRQELAQAIFDGIKEYIVTSKPTSAVLNVPTN